MTRWLTRREDVGLCGEWCLMSCFRMTWEQRESVLEDLVGSQVVHGVGWVHVGRMEKHGVEPLEHVVVVERITMKRDEMQQLPAERKLAMDVTEKG